MVECRLIEVCKENVPDSTTSASLICEPEIRRLVGCFGEPGHHFKAAFPPFSGLTEPVTHSSKFTGPS